MPALVRFRYHGRCHLLPMLSDRSSTGTLAAALHDVLAAAEVAKPIFGLPNDQALRSVKILQLMDEGFISQMFFDGGKVTV